MNARFRILTFALTMPLTLFHGIDERTAQGQELPWDLSGIWRNDGQGSSVRLVQTGDRIEATLEEPGTTRQWGWKSGEHVFSGTIDAGGALTGEIVLKYPLRVHEVCPDQAVHVDEMMSGTLAGDYRRLTIYFNVLLIDDGCRQTPAAEQGRWDLDRDPGPEVTAVEFVAPEPPFNALETVSVGEAFRVRVTFAGSPERAREPVTVKSRATDAEVVVPAFITDDPTVFLTAPLAPLPDGIDRIEP